MITHIFLLLKQIHHFPSKEIHIIMEIFIKNLYLLLLAMDFILKNLRIIGGIQLDILEDLL